MIIEQSDNLNTNAAGAGLLEVETGSDVIRNSGRCPRPDWVLTVATGS